MRVFSGIPLLTSLTFITEALCYQKPWILPGNPTPSTQNVFISSEIDSFIEGILDEYHSPGLSVAVVRRNESYHSGWLMEYGSYGTAKADGTPVTPDSLFAIASNSKLFLSLSVGLLIENQTLAEERERELSWNTRALDVFPQWSLFDKDAERIVNIQDMLSHRTGLPRHDYSGRPLEGGVSEMISNLRYLRPSAEPRETWQYNNLMYETLSYLPTLLLNQSYESFVAQNLFEPLNMSASTYSVASAESSGQLADGYMRSMRDELTGINGTLMPVIPYFSRPGEEGIWAGAGGVITSARDLAVWVAMLLENGRHPFTNKTIVPEKVVQHVAEGVTVVNGASQDPELSPVVYGAGQERYSYRGVEIIEHTGSNPGFKTQVTRLPNDNLGLVVLSNDEDYGTTIHTIVLRRLIDHILGYEPIDWNTRMQNAISEAVSKKAAGMIARPHKPRSPTHPIRSLERSSFEHPTYGALRPCYVNLEKNTPFHSECSKVLDDPVVQQIIKTPFIRNSTTAETLAIPAVIIPSKGFFFTHIMLRHFSGNLFNGSILWSNRAVRVQEGYQEDGEEDGDVITGFEDRFEVEWVPETDSDEEGLAFKGGFWGKGRKAKTPAGTGKKSAEVWFAKV
ncbi:hypothetical protein D9757_012942 [Collybiopsis confluens]|uniref:Beta-lactamase-related domain-containing protein n=1 Tax=Collybiopsis confluens TaxID=2823264 RepID=A0A8H5D4Y6_9AGAR|nr:hypothetical protein D9757_012942 [Collybiopsis confluens]